LIDQGDIIACVSEVCADAAANGTNTENSDALIHGF
jgi:hypothetical protein